MMNLHLKRTFLPSILATSLFGVTLLPAQPASADDQILRDVGIGAATGIVTGAITGDGSILTNAINGGAAGAAVNAANGTRNAGKKRYQRNRNVVQDIGVGAAGGVVSGAVTNRRHTGSNAITGAAAGAAIHLLTK